MKVSHCSDRPLIVPCNLEGLNYQIDPYIGCEHGCYYCYALNHAETNWAEEILVYEDIEEKLREELESLPPQKIYFGYYTDPYQPLEAELFQTQKVLSILQERGFSASILTKSDLVVRDIDLLKQMPDAHVSVSIAFDQEKVRKLFERHTQDTADRIEALRSCKEEGISTGALLCPVIPHITNTETLLSQLAGWADKVWIYPLSLPNTEDEPSLNVKRILEQHFAEKGQEIQSIITQKDHSYWKNLRSTLDRVQRTRGLDLSIHI